MERIGRYKIVRELGRGAMGVVYHAVDPNIGRPVAIKTIRLREVQNPQEQAKLRERLFREARSAGMLSHPGIVTIYDVEEQDGVAFIAMEFVDGPTLDHVLSEDRALAPDRMFSVLGQTAAALDYAHQKGIVHRDIKPANIMIAGDGAIKITDFGIAKITASENLTMTGTIVGTPHYMSPEQVQGKPVDGRSDQFSLTVIAYEMLTGEKPYTGEHLTTVVYRIVAEEAPPPRRINPTLTGQIDGVLRRGLSKRPDQRFRSCSEFVESLEKACAESSGWKAMVRGGSLDLPTVADSKEASPRLPPSKRSRRAAVTADTTAAKRSGFLPFLMAILVATGLLALIGWQAAPWLAKNQAAVEQPAPPAPPAAAPETAAIPSSAPAPAAAVPEEEKRPSALPPRDPEPEPEPESAAVPQAAPARGRPPVSAARTPVLVASSPAGAIASLDEGGSCRTPCSLDARPGRHTISISLAGYQTERREIMVTNSPQEMPLIGLRPAGGTLMLTSSPPGAVVVVDGQRSNHLTPVQISLTPGTHSIAIEKDGRHSSRNVEIRDGAMSYLKITLE